MRTSRILLAFAVGVALASALALARAPLGRAEAEKREAEREERQPARTDAASGEIVVVLLEGRGQRRVPSIAVGGQEFVAAADIIDILRATSYWRSETQKLLLRVGEHRVTLAVDNPFVLIDRRILRLPGRPFLRDGQVWTPAALFDLLARAGVLPGASWNPGRRLIALEGGAGTIGPLSFRAGDGSTSLTLAVAEDVMPTIASVAPGRLVVRLGGAVASTERLGEQEASGRFDRVVLSPVAEGVDLELEVSDRCRGYVVRRLGDPHRVEVIVADFTGPQGGLVFQPFNAESGPAAVWPGAGAPGHPARPAFVILDPGHGGDDQGTHSPGGKLEKHLTLELARRIERHLEQGAGFRVMLVRDHDEQIEVPRRVEIANGSGADLFLSLHLDLGSSKGRSPAPRLVVRGGGGQVLYEDLGALVPGAVSASNAEQSLSLVRWDAAGAEFGFESQRLAQNVAAKLRGAFRRDRPSVLRRPVWNLEGANMPAVLVELTAPGGGDADKALGKGETLESLAKAVASGIIAYWSGERPESEEGG